MDMTPFMEFCFSVFMLGSAIAIILLVIIMFKLVCKK